jgi:hypothetical protein
MTISLAFLAPNLVRAAIEGRLPRGIGELNKNVRLENEEHRDVETSCVRHLHCFIK